nr:MAG TPA: hypothetical protein [Caudoviricetes sp.]
MAKTVKITPELREAIRLASEEYTQLGLSRITDVDQSGIGKYISGKIQKINEDNLMRLLPILKKYLPADSQIIKIRENYGTIGQKITMENSGFDDPLDKELFNTIQKLSIVQKSRLLAFADDMLKS